MFDIGWPELMVIAIVTIVVVGPKELPRVLRTVNGYVRKLRMMASDFQRAVDEVAREADLQDIKAKMKEASSGDIGKKIEKSIDPTGAIEKSYQDMKKSIEDQYNDPANKAPGNSVTPPEPDAGKTASDQSTQTAGKAFAPKTGESADVKTDGKPGSAKASTRTKAAKTSSGKTSSGKVPSRKSESGKASAKKGTAKKPASKKAAPARNSKAESKKTEASKKPDEGKT